MQDSDIALDVNAICPLKSSEALWDHGTAKL